MINEKNKKRNIRIEKTIRVHTKQTDKPNRARNNELCAAGSKF